MKPSTELFELIKSLSKSEKRFFKLSSSLQSGEKNYLKIFDAIDKQREYDEEAIKEQFRKETFIKHFPSEKNHLYKLILKSLRAYHSDNTISSILKQEIKNIEILYKKALFKECNKFLKRAKKLAREHEKFYYLFELLSWEKLLLEEAYEAGEFTKDLDALIKEEHNVIEKLRNLAAYHVLYSKINYVFRSGGYVRSEADRLLVEEISHHPLIIGRNTALSKRAATICYYIQGFCATANVDKQTALVKFNRVKQILDENPLIRKDLSKRYIRTLSSILTLQIDLGMIEEAEAMIENMRKFANKSAFATEDIELVMFKATYLAELRILEKKGEYERAIERIGEVVDGMELNEGKFNKEQELLFMNTIASVYFGAGDFKKSLHWNNRILNDNEPNLRQDIYSYARLFNLVVHYELGNYDLLEYIVKSTYRYLSKRQRDHELEVMILNSMKKLARNAGSDDEKEILLEFKAGLNDQLKKDTDQIILEYFNFPAWIDSKIEGVSFVKVLQRKNKEAIKV
jgi:hypothetical protein